MKQLPLLLIVSFFSLFLEFLLVRLLGTEVRIFAYLSNVTLLAAFVGLGLGMLIKKTVSLKYSIIPLFVFYFLNHFHSITNDISPLSSIQIWYQPSELHLAKAIWGLFLAVILLIITAMIFVPLGQLLGRILSKGKNTIFLYSINIVASLVGMWTFNLWSWSGLSPFGGIAICQIVLLGICLLVEKRMKYTYLILVLCSMASVFNVITGNATGSGATTFWSPYQKLTLTEKVQNEGSLSLEPSGYGLAVNNIGFMGLFDLSSSALKE